MKLYKYVGYVYGDHVAGVVRAESLDEAERFLDRTYLDYYSWAEISIELVDFDEHGVCEVYFGS